MLVTFCIFSNIIRSFVNIFSVPKMFVSIQKFNNHSNFIMQKVYANDNRKGDILSKRKNHWEQSILHISLCFFVSFLFHAIAILLFCCVMAVSSLERSYSAVPMHRKCLKIKYIFMMALARKKKHNYQLFFLFSSKRPSFSLRSLSNCAYLHIYLIYYWNKSCVECDVPLKSCYMS